MKVVLPLVLRFDNIPSPTNIQMCDGAIVESSLTFTLSEDRTGYFFPASHYLIVEYERFVEGLRERCPALKVGDAYLGAHALEAISALFQQLIISLTLCGHQFFANAAAMIFTNSEDVGPWVGSYVEHPRISHAGSPELRDSGWDAERFQYWNQAIEPAYRPHSPDRSRISVALNSLLLALTFRRDDQRTISLATVTEALLSTGTTEITHQISERAAFLLERDPAERIALYKQLKRHYGRRSSYVHGSPSKKTHAAPTALGSARVPGDDEFTEIAIRLARLAIEWQPLRDALRTKDDKLGGFFTELVFGAIGTTKG